MLSMMIIVLIVGGVYGFYSLTVRIREDGQRRTDQAQLASVILSRLSREIESTTTLADNYGVAIEGYADCITVQTLVVPPVDLMIPPSIRDKQRPGEFDVRRITYALERPDPDQASYSAASSSRKSERSNKSSSDGAELVPIGLKRTEIKALMAKALILSGDEQEDQNGEGKDEFVSFELNERPEDEFDPRYQPVLEDLISPETKYFSLQYFDGQEWRRSWTGIRSLVLPQAIRITIGFSPGPMPTDEGSELSRGEVIVPEEVLLDEAKFHADRYSLVVRLPVVDDFEGTRIRRKLLE